MALAVATTACGSLALLMSGFDGLMQLGVLTAVGIVAAGAASWWLVPSLVPSGWTFRPWQAPSMTTTVARAADRSRSARSRC